MPIYEFACHQCRTVFQFFARRIGEQKVPECPKCGATDMERVLSRFAVATRRKSSDSKIPDPKSKDDDGGGEGAPDLDDPFAKMTPTQQARAEREMFKLMDQAEGLDENNPRQLGAFLRRMTEIVGDEGGPEMRDAIRRLEAGEDPEKLEEEYGDLLGLGEEEGGPGGGAGRYACDDGLYDL